MLRSRASSQISLAVFFVFWNGEFFPDALISTAPSSTYFRTASIFRAHSLAKRFASLNLCRVSATGSIHSDALPETGAAEIIDPLAGMFGLFVNPTDNKRTGRYLPLGSFSICHLGLIAEISPLTTLSNVQSQYLATTAIASYMGKISTILPTGIFFPAGIVVRMPHINWDCPQVPKYSHTAFHSAG